MKKWMAFGLLLIWMLLPAGCGNLPAGEESPAAGPEFSPQTGQAAPAQEQAPPAAPVSEETPKSPEPSAPGTLAEPPELTVSTLNQADMVAASQYGYQWNSGDGAVIACGLHPLDQKSAENYPALYTAFPEGSLPPLEEGQMSGCILSVFFLNFGEVPPTNVKAQRWPEEYIGQAQEYAGDGEEVAAEYSGGWMLEPLGDGNFVYEVNADWGELGSSTYVFRTVPQVRQPADETTPAAR